MSIICCYVAWIIIVSILVLFFVLIFKSNILRDEVDDITSFAAAAALLPKFKDTPIIDIPKPFSLARTQLAIWTVVISCTYVYLCLCHGCTIDIKGSATALALLGISIGTTTLASAIDQSQTAQPGTIRHQNQPSGGFWIDILSDENGVSIHRFQNVIWTVIAISIYLCRIDPSGCKLPELDGTLIALTGISSATYLGLKLNENK